MRFKTVLKANSVNSLKVEFQICPRKMSHNKLYECGCMYSESSKCLTKKNSHICGLFFININIFEVSFLGNLGNHNIIMEKQMLTK